MKRVLHAVDASDDAGERLDIVIEAVGERLIAQERALREMLRASVTSIGTPGTPETPLRRGRRPGWIEHALSPIRDELNPAGFDRLVSAIPAATGIEAFIVLRDIRGLTPDAACATIAWTARAILQTARAPARTVPSRLRIQNSSRHVT